MIMILNLEMIKELKKKGSMNFQIKMSLNYLNKQYIGRLKSFLQIPKTSNRFQT